MTERKERDQKKVEQYLTRYAALCRKYGLYVGGCGCCGTPFLVEDPDEDDIQENVDHLLRDLFPMGKEKQ
jgi:sugar phosphate isomerase/epimerase